MNLRRILGVLAGMAVVAVGLIGVSQPAWAALPFATPTMCTFQTSNTGNYLTAVGGGGQTGDVIHTDATVAGSWERFTLVDAGDGVNFGIKTVTGHFLTAVGGGGRTTDVIHSNATLLQAWEKFALIPQGGDVYAIRTITGNFLTAVSGGGRTTDVIHSDATLVQSWEKFRVRCNLTVVPNVAGRDRAGAESAIIAAGLRVGSTTLINTCFREEGTVLSTTPSAGTTVTRGTSVGLRVASGEDSQGNPC